MSMKSTLFVMLTENVFNAVPNSK